MLAPDWKSIVWTEEERKNGQAWAEDDRVLSHPRHPRRLKVISRSHCVDLLGLVTSRVLASAGFPEHLSPAIVGTIEKRLDRASIKNNINGEYFR